MAFVNYLGTIISKDYVCKKFVFCDKKIIYKRTAELNEHLLYVCKKIDETLQCKVINVSGTLEELKKLGIKYTYFNFITGKKINMPNRLNSVQRNKQAEFRAALLKLRNDIYFKIYFKPNI